MIKTYFTMFCLLALSNVSFALDVGDINSFISKDVKKITKEIKNSSDTGRLITVRVERISDPTDKGVVMPMESKDELLLSPARLLLPARATESIQFYYAGPSDNKERYYRIVWLDQAISDAQKTNANKSAMATASAKIGTILVVSPRVDAFSYTTTDGVLKNTGNASFKVIAYGTCKEKGASNCKESYFVLPGYERRFSKVNVADEKGHISIWHGGKFVPVK